jgi:hypothetical protein
VENGLVKAGDVSRLKLKRLEVEADDQRQAVVPVMRWGKWVAVGTQRSPTDNPISAVGSIGDDEDEQGGMQNSKTGKQTAGPVRKLVYY